MAKCGYCGAKAKGPGATKGTVVKYDGLGRVCGSAEGFCSPEHREAWERSFALPWVQVRFQDIPPFPMTLSGPTEKEKMQIEYRRNKRAQDE